MEALIDTFHLDIKLFIAQVINFAIVFVILYFLVFRPLFKVMGDRSHKIEKSLEEAKEIELRLEKTKAEQAALIQTAKVEAAAVLEEANQKAESRKDELIVKAKEEIGMLINKEKAKIQSDKSQALSEIRAEVGDLVKASLEKILSEKMDKAQDEKLIAKAVKHIE